VTAPGFVPRPDRSIVDRIGKIEARIRTMQQNTAGPTTGGGGSPLAITPPTQIGPLLIPGVGTTAARADHVHTSALAAQQDVAVGSASAGQLLTYNGAQWANSNPPGSGTFSRYKPTNGSITGAGTYTALSFGAPLDGNGAGLTLTGSPATQFTLGPGIWHVALALSVSSASTGLVLQLADNAVHTAITTVYGESGSPVLNSVAAAFVGADILSTGTAVVVAWATGNTAAGTITTTLGRPRMSFSWSPL
jgi:hypothetical protein